MRKKIAIITIAFILLSLLASCSGKYHTTEETAVYDIAPTESVTTSEKEFASMAEYVELVVSKMDESNFSSEYLTYTMYAEGDTLVYDYTYNEQFDNTDIIKENLDKSYDPENTSIQNLLSEIREHVAVETPKIKYIYRNHDGALITEQLYE